MSKPSNDRPERADYPHFEAVQTRWADNDIYGHVNNVAYYSFFDTAVNRYLIENCKLDIHGGDQIGLVVETGCRYFEPIAYPDALEVGIAVSRLGNSSVTYDVAIFRAGAPNAVAAGHFVHVYVGSESRKPAPLNSGMREGLKPLVRDKA